jgi:hypothetical protein
LTRPKEMVVKSQSKMTRPKEMVVKSQSEIDEENYGWQDSREAGDQALNRRMFLNLDERT